MVDRKIPKYLVIILRQKKNHPWVLIRNWVSSLFVTLEQKKSLETLIILLLNDSYLQVQRNLAFVAFSVIAILTLKVNWGLLKLYFQVCHLIKRNALLCSTKMYHINYFWTCISISILWRKMKCHYINYLKAISFGDFFEFRSRILRHVLQWYCTWWLFWKKLKWISCYRLKTIFGMNVKILNLTHNCHKKHKK